MATLTLKARPENMPRKLEEALRNERQHRQNQHDRAQKRAGLERRWARLNATLAILRERFPAGFCDPPVPLAIGARQAIRAELRNEIPAQALHFAMRFWTSQDEYLAAVAAGEARRNLDGSIAGEVDARHREQAAEALAKRRRVAQVRKGRKSWVKQ
jgi:sRNA-binding protein